MPLSLIEVLFRERTVEQYQKDSNGIMIDHVWYD